MTNDEATAIVRIGEKVLAEARALGWLNLSDAEALRARLAAAAESSLREARGEAERLRRALRSMLDSHADCDDGSGTICPACAIAMAELSALTSPSSPVEGDAAKTQRATVPEPQIHPQPPFPALGKRAAAPSPVEGDGARGAKVHTLKCWPEFFAALRAGRKRFELRRDDRGFSVGDCLVLQEWDPATGRYTRECLSMRVTYVARGVFGLPDDLCVMSVEPWPAPSEPESGGTTP